MSILDTNKIDSIGTDKENGNVTLTIADSLDWEDKLSHLQILQAKINSYISFIESGQIKEDFPDFLRAKKVIISIISKYDYPEIGLEFLEKVKPILDEVGVKVEQRKFKQKNY